MLSKTWWCTVRSFDSHLNISFEISNPTHVPRGFKISRDVRSKVTSIRILGIYYLLIQSGPDLRLRLLLQQSQKRLWLYIYSFYRLLLGTLIHRDPSRRVPNKEARTPCEQSAASCRLIYGKYFLRRRFERHRLSTPALHHEEMTPRRTLSAP